MDYEHLTEKQKTDMTFKAIFGDGNGDVGMKTKVDTMYDLFAGASLSTKFVKNAIIFLGTLASVGYVVYKIVMKQNPFG